MLTQENEDALNEFLESAGALDGLDPEQARAVCNDLVWKVTVIVTEAVDRNLELTGREVRLSCT
jgi:hypothetical protein